MEQSTPQPQGKGLAVTGFILALVGLVFYFIIAGVVAVQAALGGGYGLAIFWLVLCLAGTIMSVMGTMKLSKTGGKKGLGIAGLVIGAVATIFSLLLVLGVGEMQNASGEFQQELQESLDEMEANH